MSVLTRAVREEAVEQGSIAGLQERLFEGQEAVRRQLSAENPEAARAESLPRL
jgi:hypothetical protein